MIETNIKNISVDEIMQKIKNNVQILENTTHYIKSELEEEKNQINNNLNNIKSSNLYNFAKKVGKYLQKIGFSKVVHFLKEKININKYNYIYVMEDFTKYYDEKFIDNSYKLLLKRFADSEGKNYYLEQLRSANLSKSEIVISLHYSKEGRKQNIVVLGSKKRLIITLIYKIPLFGYLFKILFLIISLPKLLQRINQYENNVMSTLQNHDITLEELTKTKADKQRLIDLEELTKTKADKQRLIDLEELTKTKTDIKDYDRYLQAVSYAKEHMKVSQKNIQILIDEAKKRLPVKTLNKNELLSIVNEEKHKYDSLYVEFENHFRGTREDIKDRLKVYLPYLKKLSFVKKDTIFLDVGCGRGEWLELVKEVGYSNVKGLDLNRIMVSESKTLGFDVVESDVIKYLESLEDESLSVITGFHIIEHLPFEVMMKLFEESLRTLKKGGMVIFETPNPENLLVGACNFYTDPTHINPIPPITAQFLLQERGFVNTNILRLNLMKEAKYINDKKFSDVNDILFACTKEQDYAVIGYKV